jgi:peptidoglycan hydrolase-like protein with peptidoglycan-binding domain
MALQTVLKNAKMFNGEADGTRTDELKEAVKKYQEANGLKVTGGINAETLTKAGIALTDKQKAQVAAQAAYDAAKNKQ